MNKYEKIYLKATKRGGGSAASWPDSSVAALAVDLEEHTGKPVEVSGPFGLRAEIVIKAGDICTIITPSFENGSFKLYYDTGERTGQYQPNTLGDWNGFNNVQAPLPDTFEEIAAVITRRTKEADE